MKKLALAIILASVLLFPLWVQAAGTVTETLTWFMRPYSAEVTLAWTADSSNGSVPATALSTATMSEIYGLWVAMVTTNPGSTAPTDDYDIVITDADGIDIMGGTTINRDTSTSEQAIPKLDSTAGVYGPRMVNGILTMTLTNNSVNSATGIIRILLSR